MIKCNCVHRNFSLSSESHGLCTTFQTFNSVHLLSQGFKSSILVNKKESCSVKFCFIIIIIFFNLCYSFDIIIKPCGLQDIVCLNLSLKNSCTRESSVKIFSQYHGIVTVWKFFSR